LRLRKFRVQAFRCIHDSGDIVVGDLAAFVGRNESGKTTILQALTLLNKDEIASDLDLCDEMVEELKSEVKLAEGEFQLNKNEINISIASLITEKNKLNNLIIFSDFKNEIKKTKEMNLMLKKFDATNSLFILDKLSRDKIYRSAKNIPNVKVTDVNHFSAFDIIKFKKIIFTESSIKELEKRYS